VAAHTHRAPESAASRARRKAHGSGCGHITGENSPLPPPRTWVTYTHRAPPRAHTRSRKTKKVRTHASRPYLIQSRATRTSTNRRRRGCVTPAAAAAAGTAAAAATAAANHERRDHRTHFLGAVDTRRGVRRGENARRGRRHRGLRGDTEFGRQVALSHVGLGGRARSNALADAGVLRECRHNNVAPARLARELRYHSGRSCTHKKHARA
jgi:hypothetical protein